MQIYAEAESNANEFIRFVWPRRNSISAAGKLIIFGLNFAHRDGCYNF